MAKKPTYSVTVEGQTFTRTTARTYTHVVVGRLNVAWELAHVVSGEPEDRLDYKHYNDPTVDRDRYGSTHYYAVEARAARARTVDEYVAWKRAQRLVRIEKDRVAGRFDKLIALDWCGRPDLAANRVAARTKPRTGTVCCYIDVRAVPVPPRAG